MWTRLAVVGRVRLVPEPIRLIGCVVEDNVHDADHPEIGVQARHKGFQLRPGRTKTGVEFRVVGQAVGGVGAAELLDRVKQVIPSLATHYLRGFFLFPSLPRPG